MKYFLGVIAAALLTLCGLTSAYAVDCETLTCSLSTGDVGNLNQDHLANGTGQSRTYNITLNNPGDLHISLSPSDVGTVTFSSVVFKDGGVIAPTSDASVPPNVALVFANLVAGAYSLIVNFDVSGGGGAASYHGTATLLSANVPLPPSLPLLAAALGVLAFVMYRKQRMASL